jgi:hypothetical protein
MQLNAYYNAVPNEEEEKEAPAADVPQEKKVCRNSPRPGAYSSIRNPNRRSKTPSLQNVDEVPEEEEEETPGDMIDFGSSEETEILPLISFEDEDDDKVISDVKRPPPHLLAKVLPLSPDAAEVDAAYDAYLKEVNAEDLRAQLEIIAQLGRQNDEKMLEQEMEKGQDSFASLIKHCDDDDEDNDNNNKKKNANNKPSIPPPHEKPAAKSMKKVPSKAAGSSMDIR